MIRTFVFSKSSIIREYAKQINAFLFVLVSLVATIYLIAFNDVFGFVMTLIVLILLKFRPKDRLFFLSMYLVVVALEIGGTAYSAWSWPDRAFGVFDFLPSHNPPSGISLFYFLLDVGCFVIYAVANPNIWRRYKRIKHVSQNGVS